MGDVVNTASRLEALTKEHACQLIVSADVSNCAGIDLAAFPALEIEVRGRTHPVRIQVVASALTLEPLLASPVGGTAP